MRRSALSQLALLAVTLASSGCMWVEASQTLTRSASHLAGTHLDVLTSNGEVEVVIDPETTVVAVTADISCFGESLETAESRAAGAWLDVDRTSDGRLQVRAGCDGAEHDFDGADIRVRLPGSTDGVTVQTTNGNLYLSGLSGPLMARTTNGEVTIAGHAGDVEAQSTNGGITAQDIAGSARLATSNGNLTLVLAPDVPGPINLVTTNGTIEAALGPAFYGRVEVGTSNGSIDVTDPSGRVVERDIAWNEGHLVVGSEGQTSHLSTTNGRIVLDL